MTLWYFGLLRITSPDKEAFRGEVCLFSFTFTCHHPPAFAAQQCNVASI